MNRQPPKRLQDPLGLDKEQLASLYRGFMAAAKGREQLPLENFASLLSKYTELEPSTIRKIFIRMTNSQTISWDRFLELLHNESLLRHTMLNQRIAPEIAIEMERVEPLPEVQRELKRLNKEVRTVQEVHVQNYQFLVVFVDNELLFVDQSDEKIAVRMAFAARHQNPLIEGKKPIGMSQHMTNNSVGQIRDNSSMLTQTDFASGILTNNLKKSIKLLPEKPEQSSKSQTRQNSPHERKFTPEGSSMMFPRRSGNKRRTFERMKRSNIDQIFQMFRQLPAGKDTQLCRLYTESDEPQLLIDRTMANCLKNNQAGSVPSTKQKINFKGLIETMKGEGRKLSYNPRRLTTDQDVISSSSNRLSLLLRDPKPVRDKATALENSAKKRNTFIHSFSIHKDLIAVALATKEIRVLKMRKYFFNKVITEQLFCRSYPEPPLFVHLYECNLRVGKLFLFMALEENEGVAVRVRELTDKWELGSVVYSHQLQYYPCFEVIKDIGVTGFNEMGQLAIFEIGGARSKQTIRCMGPYQMRNQSNGKKMPISLVKYSKKTLSLVFGCLDGFVYTYSYARMQLRKMRKLSAKSITGLEIQSKVGYIVTLSADGRCRLINIETFEVFNELDLHDHDLIANRGLTSKLKSQPQSDRSANYFYVFGQHVAKVYITEDQVKQNKLKRNQTTYDERIKMFAVSQQLSPPPAFTDSDSFMITKLWMSNGYLLMFSEDGKVKMLGQSSSIWSARQFYPRKTRNVVEMAVCPTGILYAQTDEDYNLEVANICTQQCILTAKVDGMSSVVFLPRDMREILCVGTNKGDCLLLKEQTNELLTEHKAPTQTHIQGNPRVEITVCRFFDKLLVTGNDRGDICIFTKNLYSLKHSIKLNIATQNARMDSVTQIKQFREGRLLVLTSQPALFDVDVIEGSIIQHWVLPYTPTSIIADFNQHTFCEKSAKLECLKTYQLQQNNSWFSQTFEAAQLRLFDIYHCWLVGNSTLRAISTNTGLVELDLVNGKWQTK